MNKKLHLILMAVCCLLNTISAQTISGTKTLSASNNFTISVSINTNTDMVEIIMTGPMNRYNSVGFGSFSMTNTYAVVAESSGNIFERKLGNHNGGTALSSSLTTMSYTTSGNIATTTVTRPRVGMNGNYFTFPNTPSSISIIWAKGNNGNYGNHSNEGATTLTLTADCVNTSSTSNPIACGSYTLPDGSTVSTSGTYTNVIMNAAGCDSTITTNLTINPVYNINENEFVCTGDSYVFPDGFTESNITSTVTHTSQLMTGQGCDSIINTTVFANPTINISTSSSVCMGDNYTFPDGSVETNITQNIVQTSQLAGQGMECDTFIETNLTVTIIDASTSVDGLDITSAQDGATYTWLDCDNGNTVIPDENGQTFTATSSGNYAVEVTLNSCTSVSDCVSICVNTTSTFNPTTCGSYTLPDGSTVSTSGTYTNVIMNAAGCDSTITTNLTINPVYNINENASVCIGSSYVFPDGTTESNITSTVTHTSQLMTGQGCDSLINTSVSVSPTVNISTSSSVCMGDNYTFPDGSVETNITQNIVQTSQLTGQGMDCDTLIETSLSVTIIDASTSVDGLVITSAQEGATYTWLDCDNGNTVIPDENGQNFTATSNGNYAVEVTLNGCTSVSDCVSITTVGTYNPFKEQLSVFPTLTKGQVFIDLGVHSNENLLITIRDQTGRMLSQKSNNLNTQQELFLKGNAGIYFIEIQSKSNSAVFKVIKQ